MQRVAASAIGVRRMLSVNPEAANNKNSLLYLAAHALTSLILYLMFDSYYSVNILRASREEKNKINNNEANNKAASYIINLGARCVGCSTRAAHHAALIGLGRLDVTSRSICPSQKPVSLVSRSKLKRSIILLDSIIIVVC